MSKPIAIRLPDDVLAIVDRHAEIACRGNRSAALIEIVREWKAGGDEPAPAPRGRPGPVPARVKGVAIKTGRELVVEAAAARAGGYKLPVGPVAPKPGSMLIEKKHRTRP